MLSMQLLELAKIIQIYLLMNLTLSKTTTIKQKKTKIISSEPSYTTPAKSINFQTPLKKTNPLASHNILSNFDGNLTERKQSVNLPQNALMKKCFQKKRPIKSIKDLTKLHQSRVISLSKYRFDSQVGQTQHLKEESYKNRKNYYDKVASNILAHEQSIIGNCMRSRSRSKRRNSFSQSKIIKMGIIHYE